MPESGSSHEGIAEAARLAADVTRDVRTRMPFVPAYLKALAGSPRALLEAWLQTRALCDDAQAQASAARLLAAADPELDYRPSEAVRRAVRPFVGALPTLLLAVASLRLSLDGALPLRPQPDPALRASDAPVLPEVPDEGDDPVIFPEIRRVYGAVRVPSIYRSLAARGALAEPWAAVGPFLDSASGRELEARLSDLADVEARRYPEVSFMSDGAARAIVDDVRRALPRNLVFAVAAYRTESGSREER